MKARRLQIRFLDCDEVAVKDSDIDAFINLYREDIMYYRGSLFDTSESVYVIREGLVDQLSIQGY